MKASEAKETLEVGIKAKRPVFFWGSPGIGKSQITKQVCDTLDLQMLDVRVGQMDPVDIRGGLYIKDGMAKWSIPAFLPQEPKSKGVIFLDEMNTAPKSVQAACYQLVLDRAIGEYNLPDNWAIIAAGNLETDKAVANKMSTALANRFIHITLDVDLEEWIAWALANKIRTDIVAFMRFRPGLLHDFNPNSKNKAFPSPRSWEMLSNVMDIGISSALEYDLCSGTVGEGAASEYIGFLKIFRSLPNREQIIMNPNKASVPKDPATLYATCGALSAIASDQNFEAIVTYAGRLPAEFSVLLIRDSVRKEDKLVNTRAFIEWASKNSEVLI